MYTFRGERYGECLHRIPKGNTKVLRSTGNACYAVVLDDNVTEPDQFYHDDATSVSLHRA